MTTWREEDEARSMRLWEDTRRPAFASKERIDTLRKQHGLAGMTHEEYHEARRNYYAKYPTARTEWEQ